MQENQRVVITKKLLREGLLRLLETKPIEKINITELCREAGINRATFYRHYELPRDILFEIENEMIWKVREMFPKPNTMDEAKRYTENTLTYLYEQADLLKVLSDFSVGENFGHILNEFYQSFLELKGEIQSFSDLDEDSSMLLSTYCVGGIYCLLRQWIIEGSSKSPKEITELIFRFIDKDIAF